MEGCLAEDPRVVRDCRTSCGKKLTRGILRVVIHDLGHQFEADSGTQQTKESVQ